MLLAILYILFLFLWPKTTLKVTAGLIGLLIFLSIFNQALFYH